MRDREEELIEKETEIIETARIKYGIDFENPKQFMVKEQNEALN